MWHHRYPDLQGWACFYLLPPPILVAAQADQAVSSSPSLHELLPPLSYVSTLRLDVYAFLHARAHVLRLLPLVFFFGRLLFVVGGGGFLVRVCILLVFGLRGRLSGGMSFFGRGRRLRWWGRVWIWRSRLRGGMRSPC